MVVSNFWTTLEIYEYLDEYGGSIVVVGVTPTLSLPQIPCNRWGRHVKRKAIIEEVLPHLIHRREEILARDPQYKFRKNRLARDHIIHEIAHRAIESGRDVAYMCPPELRPVLIGQKGKRGSKSYVPDVPDEALWICVLGDDKWTSLPAIVTPREPKPIGKRKRKRYEWNGG